MAEQAAARDRAITERDAALEADRKGIIRLERELAGALKRLADTKNPLLHLELYFGIKDERIMALEARGASSDLWRDESFSSSARGTAQMEEDVRGARRGGERRPCRPRAWRGGVGMDRRRK